MALSLLHANPIAAQPSGEAAHAGNERAGLTWGLGLGIGPMQGDTSRCFGCTVSTLGIALDGRIGAMILPRLAVVAEGHLVSQTANSISEWDHGAVVVQRSAIVAAKYWMTERLWVKGGLGISDVWATSQLDKLEIGIGAALAAGIGYELSSSPHLSVDLEAGFIAGLYDSFNRRVTSQMLDVGFNLF